MSKTARFNVLRLLVALLVSLVGFFLAATLILFFQPSQHQFELTAQNEQAISNVVNQSVDSHLLKVRNEITEVLASNSRENAKRVQELKQAMVKLEQETAQVVTSLKLETKSSSRQKIAIEAISDSLAKHYDASVIREMLSKVQSHGSYDFKLIETIYSSVQTHKDHYTDSQNIVFLESIKSMSLTNLGSRPQDHDVSHFIAQLEREKSKHTANIENQILAFMDGEASYLDLSRMRNSNAFREYINLIELQVLSGSESEEFKRSLNNYLKEAKDKLKHDLLTAYEAGDSSLYQDKKSEEIGHIQEFLLEGGVFVEALKDPEIFALLIFVGIEGVDLEEVVQDVVFKLNSAKVRQRRNYNLWALNECKRAETAFYWENILGGIEVSLLEPLVAGIYHEVSERRLQTKERIELKKASVEKLLKREKTSLSRF